MRCNYLTTYFLDMHSSLLSKTTRHVKKTQGKMKLHISIYLNNCGAPTLIFYKPCQRIIKTPTEKVDSLRVNIKAQTGDKNNETVQIYGPLFRTGRPEALLNFVTILKKIIKG